MYVPPFEEEPMREFDRRPWGSYTVLEEAPTFKVKRIEVLPGKRLSYQKHSQRAEHWFVVQGTAKVTLDDNEITVRTGESIDIPIGAAHRVENPGNEDLIFIEVQRGNYLGEDDIVRLQDDYGRTS
jgi:mannose-6-phosphate isomerase